MSDAVPKVCPPGMARNSDFVTKRGSRNPDVNHFSRSDREGRGDAADKWLTENDPTHRKHHKRVIGHQPSLLVQPPNTPQEIPMALTHTATTSTPASTPFLEDDENIAPSSDVKLYVRNKTNKNGDSHLTIFLEEHLVKYLFRKSNNHHRMRVNIVGAQIQIIAPDNGTTSKGRVYAITQNPGSSKKRIQISAVERMFNINTLRSTHSIGVTYQKGSEGPSPCIFVDIPKSLFLESYEDEVQVVHVEVPTPQHAEPEHDYTQENPTYSYVEPDEEALSGPSDQPRLEPTAPIDPEEEELLRMIEEEEAQKARDTQAAMAASLEPEQPAETHTESEKDAPMPNVMEATVSVATQDNAAPDAVTLMRAMLAEGTTYEQKLESLAVAASLLNDALSDPMLASLVTATVVNNRVEIEAPVIVRKRLI